MIEPQKVEVVRAEMGFVGSLFCILFVLAFKTFFVWWAAASWFPQFGLTYWQLVLPVCVLPMLFSHGHEIRRTFKPASWSLKTK